VPISDKVRDGLQTSRVPFAPGHHRRDLRPLPRHRRARRPPPPPQRHSGSQSGL